ncbi:hypothetical protein JCM19301_1510 [Jejuia pallidilutea]|uniref:Lipoprotein n=1 Tax=Jejuia pallidilutea TaxID=504487 RepID=A0A090VVL0_9FLAO|nr:hypothetical protein JCM19301_1510 [Jejuia pallidilutea]
MKKVILLSLSTLFLLSSCVSKKEFLALEEKTKRNPRFIEFCNC